MVLSFALPRFTTWLDKRYYTRILPVYQHSDTPSSPTSHKAVVRSFLHRSPVPKLLAALTFCFLFGHYALSWLSPLGPPDVSRLFIVSDDKYHRIFEDTNPGQASSEVLPIRAYGAMSDECVEEWVVHHIWGAACKNTDLSDGLKLDGVWAWVNGSDPAQISARQRYRPSDSVKVDAAHRYGDHNELLYSMRSFLQSIGDKALNKMHIMASAYPIGDAFVGNGTMMAGQIPHWLTKSSTTDPNSKIVLHYDSELFAPAESVNDPPMSAEAVQEWRRAAVPSFSSLAVEAEMFNLPPTASDQLVYHNDDFFTLKENAIADYSSPLFGPVMRSLPRVTSYYIPAENTWWRLWNPVGEEVGIKRAAWVLGNRFPMRALPYITHHPRTLWLPLLREAALTFPSAFSNTALGRFRSMKDGPIPVQPVFLASWYVVQRHREALLWSWAVAKWGGAEEHLTSLKRDGMWDDIIGEGPGSGVKITSKRITLPIRDVLEDMHAFEDSGMSRPMNTEYSFSSKDGYALSYLDTLWFWQRPRNGWPDLAKTPPAKYTKIPSRSILPSTSSRKTICTVRRNKCLKGKTPQEIFKRIAFEYPECGDCIIPALMGTSGSSGISAFLPSADVVIPPSHSSRQVSPSPPPHLPLTQLWRTTDFAVSSVLPPSSTSRSLRTWSTRLIQRYQYVLGTTPSEMYQMKYPDPVKQKLETVGQQNLTFFCLNDDVKDGLEVIEGLLTRWFESLWPNKLPDEI